MYTCDRGTLLTFPFVCFDCKISIRIMNFDCVPFFGGDDFTGVAVLVASTAQVEVPTDLEIDVSGRNSRTLLPRNRLRPDP